MHRFTAKTLLLLWAAWLSLFIGLAPANAGELYALGSWGSWDADLMIRDDQSMTCAASTQNSDGEQLMLHFDADGTISLTIMVPGFQIDSDFTADIRFLLDAEEWDLTNANFRLWPASQSTAVVFGFPAGRDTANFLSDLGRARLAALQIPGTGEVTSIWLLDGSTAAIRKAQECMARIADTGPGEKKV